MMRLTMYTIAQALLLTRAALQVTSTPTKFYEGESTVHSIALQKASEVPETPSFVFATSGATKEENITIFKTQVWYTTQKAFELDLMPPARLACFNNKSPSNADQEDCLVASALTTRGFNIDTGSLLLKDVQYNFKGSDSRYYDEEKISQNVIASQSTVILPLENVDMALDVIDSSSYFLCGISSGFGLFRWEAGSTEMYAEVNLDDIMTAGTGIVDRFFKDIKVIQNSKWVLISFYGWRTTAVVDFVDMKIQTKMADSGSGEFAVLNKDPSLGYFAKADGSKVQLMKYADGTEVKSFKTYYFITTIEAVHQSHLVFVAEDTLLKVYNLDDEEPAAKYEYDTTEGIYALKFDYMAGVILVGGSKVGQYISINDPTTAECHPNCDGGCTKGFSPSHCSSCSVLSESKEGSCSLKNIKEVEGGNVDYPNVQWSKPTVDTKEAGSTDESFFQKLTGEYRNMLIIVIGLLGVCAICCCAK